MTERPIDAVLFDLGQVLVEWDPFGPYAGRYDRAEVQRFFDEIDFIAFNHHQDAGRTWSDARAALGESHPHRVSMLDVYTEHFIEAVPGEVPGAAELVADLQGIGIRTLGLTNWSAETFHVAAVRAPVVSLLEDVLVSGRVGIAKPDRVIFAIAAQVFSLEPSRTLFTDDSVANIEAAAALGFRTELFVGIPALRRSLDRVGVPVADRLDRPAAGQAPRRT